MKWAEVRNPASASILQSRHGRGGTVLQREQQQVRRCIRSRTGSKFSYAKNPDDSLLLPSASFLPRTTNSRRVCNEKIIADALNTSQTHSLLFLGLHNIKIYSYPTGLVIIHFKGLQVSNSRAAGAMGPRRKCQCPIQVVNSTGVAHDFIALYI